MRKLFIFSAFFAFTTTSQSAMEQANFGTVCEEIGGIHTPPKTRDIPGKNYSITWETCHFTNLNPSAEDISAFVGTCSGQNRLRSVRYSLSLECEKKNQN